MSSTKYRYVPGEPPEGTPTLGVVYHMIQERYIADMAHRLGFDCPLVIGYVVVDEDADPSNGYCEHYWNDGEPRCGKCGWIPPERKHLLKEGDEQC